MTISEANALTQGYDRLDELIQLKDQQLTAGGSDRIQAQHDKGKLNARERIGLFLDHGSFEELDSFVLHNCTHFKMGEQKYLGDAVIAGYGTVNGRKTFVFARISPYSVGPCR